MNYNSAEDTERHILKVSEYINRMLIDLKDRSFKHDHSKFEPLEKYYFDTYTPRLKGLKYGTKEYADALREMKPALDHHYANNRHHPQFFNNGIRGMNLVDLMEMIADWKAASERSPQGDIMKSIDINAKRFNMSDDLVQILKNTVEEYFL